jgi:hypothetical protein
MTLQCPPYDCRPCCFYNAEYDADEDKKFDFRFRRCVCVIFAMICLLIALATHMTGCAPQYYGGCPIKQLRTGFVLSSNIQQENCEECSRIGQITICTAYPCWDVTLNLEYDASSNSNSQNISQGIHFVQAKTCNVVIDSSDGNYATAESAYHSYAIDEEVTLGFDPNTGVCILGLKTLEQLWQVALSFYILFALCFVAIFAFTIQFYCTSRLLFACYNPLSLVWESSSYPAISSV